jgi:ABC-type oligopeptide transport system ATPase subunit
LAQAPILEVQDLKTYFFTRTGVVKAMDEVSFTLMALEAVLYQNLMTL